MFDAIKEIVPPAEMEEAVFTDEKQVREENIRNVTAKLEEAFAEKEDSVNKLDNRLVYFMSHIDCFNHFCFRNLISSGLNHNNLFRCSRKRLSAR